MEEKLPAEQDFLSENNSCAVINMGLDKKLINIDTKVPSNLVNKSWAENLSSGDAGLRWKRKRSSSPGISRNQVEFLEAQSLLLTSNSYVPNPTQLDKTLTRKDDKNSPTPVFENNSLTEEIISLDKNDFLPIAKSLASSKDFAREYGETFMKNTPPSLMQIRCKEQMELSEDQEIQSMNNAYTKYSSQLEEDIFEADQIAANCAIEPMFEDYQLIGDSQLLRFSEQLLFYKCRTDPFNGARALGLCVSGQTVGELQQRIFSKKYGIHEKVILLIGTNDMLRSTSLETMMGSLKDVLKELKQNAKEIIVLTLPPVPCLSNMHSHWYRLNVYNNYIRKQEKGKQIRVAAVADLFLTGHRTCHIDDFELFYSDMKRQDKVHLNRQGLEKIHNFLYEKMF